MSFTRVSFLGFGAAALAGKCLKTCQGDGGYAGAPRWPPNMPRAGEARRDQVVAHALAANTFFVPWPTDDHVLETSTTLGQSMADL